jgi:stress-induced morphogen
VSLSRESTLMCASRNVASKRGEIVQIWKVPYSNWRHLIEGNCSGDCGDFQHVIGGNPKSSFAVVFADRSLRFVTKERASCGRPCDARPVWPIRTQWPRAGWRRRPKQLAMQSSLSAQLEATHVKVVDVSGGCGSMYDVEVVSPRFAGLTRVKQHRLVNEVGTTSLCNASTHAVASSQFVFVTGSQDGDQGHARTHDPHDDARAVCREAVDVPPQK